MKRFSRRSLVLVAVLLVLSALGSMLLAQVTTSSINGTITDKSGQPLPGATIRVVHEPSGTQYGTSSREDGRFDLSGLRVGGPYTAKVSFVGYQTQEMKNINLFLGQNYRVEFKLSESAVEVTEVQIVGERNNIMSAGRTGAASSVSREQIDRLPTITRRINDFIRLTPQASGASFAGQDNRLNNVTVDGAYFNNSFGLAGLPGERTGVAPISMDAIEQIQVNVAPFDVRQGNFVGAGVNTVTRSGTNEFSGSAYYQFRNQDYVGTEAKDLTYNPGTFEWKQVGVRLGGPIIENKLFFFVNYETDKNTYPATTFRANTGSETVQGSVTRVLATDLDTLSMFLASNFGYQTGPYQGYNFKTPATRLFAKLDFNIDDKNKVTVHYNHLDSETDVLLSNSTSLGFGNRRSSANGLNFANSNYGIQENNRSLIAEWNSILADNMANNLVVGYTSSDESRTYRGSFFPMVDILSGGTVYTTFGFEAFTPNNELRYNSYQLQDNFTYQMADHYFTVGLSIEKYRSENVFYPGAQSIYVYNSLADFYRDAKDYIANPARTVSPVTLNKFQVRYINQPGMVKPVQPLDVLYAGGYIQDEWQATKNLKLTLGIRVDVPSFGDNGFANTQADTLNFMDENFTTVKYSTAKLPDPKLLWSPRLGFNWDVNGDRSTQVRGGTGVFTARPAYVWISNQIGNTGVLTGFKSATSTTAYPFNPNTEAYKPASVTGAPAATYELALTDPNYKFPQIWRTNLAVDQELPYGVIGTGELIYNRDVNGTYYINANLTKPNSQFAGVDNRPRWNSALGSSKINSMVDNAIVLKNQSVGYSYNLSGALELPYTDGFYAKAAYSYGVSKNTVDPGSIAAGSWNGNAQRSNPNDPGVGYSTNSPGNRAFLTASYRLEYFDIGATTIAMFLESRTIGNYSYIFSGDVNGDGNSSNDLVYIPKDQTEMNFTQLDVKNSAGTVVKSFSAQTQAEAWDAFIKQDPYLSEHRGEYAVRGGAFLPMVTRADLSITQEVFTNFMDKKNTLQFRADFLNFTNLLNKNWGVSQAATTTTPLTNVTPGADGKVKYTLRTTGTAEASQLIKKSFVQTLTLDDVFRFQFTIRYIFN